MAQRFIGLLEQGLEDTALPIGEFSMLLPQEQARLQHWNATAQPNATPQTLHQRIEAQAARTPTLLRRCIRTAH